jgi:hypothetical protein
MQSEKTLSSAPVHAVVHTPGPWTAGKPQWKRGGPPYKIPINAAGGTVANVLTHESIQWHPLEQRDPQPNGDAKIIALAPEMWQAIQGALRIADLWRPSDDTPEEHGEEAKALYMMLSQFEEIARKVV